jgi:hypothetical protein
MPGPPIPKDGRQTDRKRAGRQERTAPLTMADEPIETTPAPEPATDPNPAPPEETIPKSEHQRELDRLRNELGQFKRRTRELEDASKSEAEKLAERAKLADTLEPEVTALRAALSAEVDEQQKHLPKEMLDLMPGGSPSEQLAWIRKARQAAEKLKPAGALPTAGGRNPGNAADGASDAARLEALKKQYPSLARRQLIG